MPCAVSNLEQLKLERTCADLRMLKPVIGDVVCLGAARRRDAEDGGDGDGGGGGEVRGVCCGGCAWCVDGEWSGLLNCCIL